MSEWVLDRPGVVRVLFHPRREGRRALQREGVIRVTFEVEPGVHVGGRLYPADDRSPIRSPAILFFHGNGEIAADYDEIAPLYTEIGVTLLVVDYRGYDSSGGRPTGSHLLADAVHVFEHLDGTLEAHGLAPVRRYVMGRSLGSAAAIEVATHAGDRLAGLIVESGFSDTRALLALLGVRVEGFEEGHDGFANAIKIETVMVPTLVIHSANDVLIPAADGEALSRHAAAKEKRLVLIPGAGHNDLLWTGRTAYFEAIREWVWPFLESMV